MVRPVLILELTFDGISVKIALVTSAAPTNVNTVLAETGSYKIKTLIH